MLSDSYPGELETLVEEVNENFLMGNYRSGEGMKKSIYKNIRIEVIECLYDTGL